MIEQEKQGPKVVKHSKEIKKIYIKIKKVVYILFFVETLLLNRK